MLNKRLDPVIGGKRLDDGIRNPNKAIRDMKKAEAKRPDRLRMPVPPRDNITGKK